MNENLELKIRNLTYIVIGGFVVTFLLLIGLYFRSDGWTTKESSNTGNSGTNETYENYDTSRFTILEGDKVVDLFKDKKTHILLIGRHDCGVCQSLLPELNKVIDETNLEVNYFEVGKNWSTDMEPFVKYLDIKTTISSGGEDYDGTYGELVQQYGFTPVTIIIQNGKMVQDSFVGARSADELKSIFSKYFDF